MHRTKIRASPSLCKERMNNKRLLKELYIAIEERIETVRHSSCCDTFKIFPFALYDEKNVCMRDVDNSLNIFDKTPYETIFCANTAVEWKGGYIAIWCISGAIDEDVLASKLLHEMYHAHQHAVGDERFADEFNAVFEYRCTPELLTLKLRENSLLAELTDNVCISKLNELAALRARRKALFPYEYSYESKVETIEGSAQYIELEALKLLNESKYSAAIRRIKHRIMQLQSLLPARIGCYDTGALLLITMRGAGFDMNTVMAKTHLTISDIFIGKSHASCADNSTFVPDAGICEYIDNDRRALVSLVEKALSSPAVVSGHGLKLLGFNVYNARSIAIGTGMYLYTQCFLMYSDKGVERILSGDHIVRIGEGRSNITEVFAI